MMTYHLPGGSLEKTDKLIHTHTVKSSRRLNPVCIYMCTHIKTFYNINIVYIHCVYLIWAQIASTANSDMFAFQMGILPVMHPAQTASSGLFFQLDAIFSASRSCVPAVSHGMGNTVIIFPAKQRFRESTMNLCNLPRTSQKTIWNESH